MFTFGFSGDESEVGNKAARDSKKILKWFPAVEIKFTADEFPENKFDYYTSYTITDDVNLKIIRSEDVVLNLNKHDHDNIIEAESQHSDLVPAIYEGGLKIWECTFDLAKYYFSKDTIFENSKILDLGCGAGILGISGLLKGSCVHFQDYNAEVIKLVTIPNVILNLKNHQAVNEKAEFYAGDWESVVNLLEKKYPDENDKYDVILSSETIYNSDNHEKLYKVFKERLKTNGVGYVAGKIYYFGVGGSMRQFESLVKEDNVFDTEVVWQSEEGVQREILKLTRRL